MVYEKADDGTIWARVPDLAGCYTYGSNLHEAKANIQEVLQLYIGNAKFKGISIRKPHHIKAELISVAESAPENVPLVR